MRAALAALLLAVVALGGDRTLGSLRLDHDEVPLVWVHAARQADSQHRSWTTVLVADRPVVGEDRSPSRLLALARAGRLRAVRFAWPAGSEAVQATPYAADLANAGRPVRGATATSRDDGRRIEARLQAEGDGWRVDARVSAALEFAGMAAVERLAEAPPSAWPEALGHRRSGDELVRAVYDANLDAVRALLDGGLCADSPGADGEPALLHAAKACASGEPGDHAAIIRALLLAGAEPDTRDANGATPLMWAAQLCPIEAVEALLDAGADVNARAKGGATPLMMAEAMQRPDVADRLKRAGARPWR